MMRIGFVVVLVLPVSGCVDAWTDPDASACREGTGLFVEAQHHPGFTGPEYQYMFYGLTREGVVTYVRADTGWSNQDTGSGQIRPKAGALHNTTIGEVKKELQRAGVYSTSKDFNVSVAWKDTVSADRFAELCDEVVDEFYGYKSRYEDALVADCDGFTIKASTTKGVHSSYSYCQAGPQGVRDAFDRLAEEARARFGVTGL